MQIRIIGNKELHGFQVRHWIRRYVKKKPGGSGSLANKIALWLVKLKVINRQEPSQIYSLVPNNKNAHKGMFPRSTTRARRRVPEMLYIFV